MEKLKKIGIIEGIALVTIFMINELLLNVPKVFFHSVGTATPINIIYISIIIIFICIFLYKLFKPFENMDILDVSEALGGKFLKIVIGILFIGLFAIASATTLRNFSEILKSIYLPKTPLLVLSISFLICSIILNKAGFKTITLTNVLIVPIVLINILIMFAFAIPMFNPSNLLPILGNGIEPTFFSGLSNIYAFNGISILFFLMPFFDKKEDFKKVNIIGIIISSLLLILSITSLLLVFNLTIIKEESLSMYWLIRMIGFGRFFQRIDSMFILLWIMSALSYLAVNLFLIIHIFKKLTKLNKIKIWEYLFSIIILLVSLIPQSLSDIIFTSRLVYKYYVLILVFGLSFIILILANFRKKHIGEKYD